MFFKGTLLGSSSSPVSFSLLKLPPRFGHRLHLSWRPRFDNLYESPLFWVGMYFTTNLALTIYNKSVLIEFPFPYTLTALHALCSAAGATLLLRSGAVVPTDAHHAAASLNSQEIVVLILFSMLFTVNIAVSNISLDLVTIPFHQVVRATTPVFIVLLSGLLLGSRSNRNKVLSLIPVVAGVSIATYGDFSFSWWGLILTLLGTVLSAMKTITTHLLQTTGPLNNSKQTYTRFTSFFQLLGPRPTLSTLSPVELLRLLSPLAFIQALLLAYFTGEFGAMYRYAIHNIHHRQRLLLVIDGLLAFALNIASFGTNKRVGALTMTVAGNVKQVLTMLLAVMVFNVRITSTHALGIVITLIGGACYTAVELRDKKRAKHVRESSLPSPALHNDIHFNLNEKPHRMQETRT
ncbi:hypothetical protein M378DRAFT_80446 [Amanita muscaria Koide BX008]|uniref:Sugar phosphate transporter domain-containing protein n=1 Tax=Amanita muscaria (strain Koide BX008) TaxID=946122 RepID=A0A0C2X2L0_AMAMK|nr:hypothetical protein M378DRAFT_80446 [Amanita muscaria Koide BX008]